jgi:diguanylate cyclase (GGDEF)-like protein/PAS domain S-box-containing protein
MVEPFRDIDRLLKAGYFVADYRKDEVTLSRFMAGLGYSPQEFIPKVIPDSIHPADRATYDTLWARVVDGREDDFFAEYRIRNRRGNYRWVQTTCTVLERSPSGEVLRLFGHDRDIGLRKQSESLLHARFLDLERRYLMSESLRIAGSVVTASLDLDSTVPVILEQAGTLFPFTGARVWAYRDGVLELLGQEEETSSVDLFSPPTGPLVVRVALEKTPLIIDNLATRLGSSGQAHQAAWIGIPLVFQGVARGVIEFWHEETGFFRSEHVWPAMAFADNVAVGLFNARQYRATQEASETDPLTGLATRRKLERVGPRLFVHAREEGHDLTAFMIDLDRFKTINDRFGHSQGDAVLRHFAQTCQSVLRKGDIICRYGGDEFVALLPHTAQDDARMVADRIIELFKRGQFPIAECKLSLSLGLASLRQGDYEDLAALLEAADTALYQVKERGRDGIAVFQT